MGGSSYRRSHDHISGGGLEPLGPIGVNYAYAGGRKVHEACQESLSLWCKTVLFLATCYQPLKQFVSESIIVDAPSVNAVKKHLELLAATKEDGFMDSQSA